MRGIYVAAPWTRRGTALGVAHRLRLEGHVVTSHWHDLQTETDDPAFLRQEAQTDRGDIHRSDVLLVLNLELSEGKAVEMGMALAWNIRVIVVGDISNIFQRLPVVTMVESVTEAIALLAT